MQIFTDTYTDTYFNIKLKKQPAKVFWQTAKNVYRKTSAMESNFNEIAALDLGLFLKKNPTAYVSWELWETFHCKKRCIQNPVKHLR